MLNRERMVGQLLGMLTELDWQPPAVNDPLALLRDGEYLTTGQVKTILECTEQAVRDLIGRAAFRGMPVAQMLSTWIISKTALFAYLEEHEGGKPARVKAENLFKEHWPRWSQAPTVRTEVKERAAG